MRFVQVHGRYALQRCQGCMACSTLGYCHSGAFLKQTMRHLAGVSCLCMVGSGCSASVVGPLGGMCYAAEFTFQLM